MLIAEIAVIDLTLLLNSESKPIHCQHFPNNMELIYNPNKVLGELTQLCFYRLRISILPMSPLTRKAQLELEQFSSPLLRGDSLPFPRYFRQYRF